MPSPSHSRNPSFLIIALRYIGDVLLSTPLALSIKQHIPDATVDYLVFRGTEDVLKKNPHVRRIHTIAPGSSGFSQLCRLFRRYDHAIATGWSDRMSWFAWLTGRRSQGFHANRRQDRWKQRLLTRCLFFDGRLHMVPLMLTQLEPLQVPAVRRVVMAFDKDDGRFANIHLPPQPFILLHPYSRRAYKHWPATAWAELAAMLQRETGARAMFTPPFSPGDQEQLRLIQATAGSPLDRLPGPFTLSQLAAAIHRSRAFVGIDTAATHMAAALDVPTIAIYGPTPALTWGPWPNDWPTGTPYSWKGRMQKRGCITLLQTSWPCVPCCRETCALNRSTKMECLDAISPADVLDAIQQAHVTTDRQTLVGVG